MSFRLRSRYIHIEEKGRCDKNREILTPEVRNECSGLAILVVTHYEYEMIQNPLWNEGCRKKEQYQNK